MDASISNLRLLSLPNEVLTMIHTNTELSAKDMCAIRLSCKELNAIVQKDFAKRYFQDPFVMMTKESLQALVDICKHPVFGPYVRKVQLLNHRFNACLLPGLATVVAGASLEMDETKMQLAKARLRFLMNLIDEQFNLTTSGDALKLLIEAFEILGTSGKPIALASQQLNLQSHPIGCTKVLLDFDHEDSGYTLHRPEVYSTLKILLNAAQAAKCSVTELEVGVDSLDAYRSVQTSDARLSFQQFSKPLLADVKKFRFGFEWEGRYGQQNFTAPNHISLLLRCLPEHLKTFVLCSDMDATKQLSYLGNYFTSECFSVMRIDKLESICLSKLCINEQGLFRLLNLSKKTLVSLALKDIFLIGDWDAVLTRIAASCSSLQQVSLDGAHEVINDRTPYYHSSPERTSKWYSSAFDCRGKDAFRLGLEAFIEQQNVERQEVVRQEAERKKARRAEQEAMAGEDYESEDDEQTEAERLEDKRQAARLRKEQKKQQERDRPLRRSSRLAKKKAAADQS